MGRDAARAAGREFRVDHARHGLEGRGPVAVAAAEHDVAHALQRCRCKGALVEPLAELDRVVRRRAVVGRAGDDHGALCRQFAGVVVEGGAGDIEAIGITGVGKLARDAFSGAQVRAEEHQQRRVVRRPVGIEGWRRGRRRRGRNRRRAWPGQIFATRPWAHLDVELVGLHRQRLLDLQRIAVRIEQFEALQYHRQHERRLLHGKLAADAGALAVAERLVGAGGALRFRFTRMILRIEHVGAVAPDRAIFVQAGDQHDGLIGLLDLVLAADDLDVLVRRHGIGGRRRPDAQGFFQHFRDVVELCHLLVGRRRRDIRAEHTVHLRHGLGHDVGVLQQVVDGEREQPAGRLVAGDQEGDRLIADLQIIQPLAGFLVDAGHHVGQQIALVLGQFGMRAPLLDDPVHRLIHVADVGLELVLSVSADDVLERQTTRAHGGVERAHHGVDERVIVAAVETIEAIVESREADRVERQRGHVAHDVDLVVGVEARPLLDQLGRDIRHHRVVANHGPLGEVRQQDVVRLRPVRLVGVGGEQPIASERADAAQGPAHCLVEARLVRQFGYQIGAGDDDNGFAHHVEPVDRA